MWFVAGLGVVAALGLRCRSVSGAVKEAHLSEGDARREDVDLEGTEGETSWIGWEREGRGRGKRRAPGVGGREGERRGVGGDSAAGCATAVRLALKRGSPFSTRT